MKYLKDPTVEQAFPEYLQTTAKFSDALVYFYHPQTPIVICGVHQNVFAEVNMAYLQAHGIDLVRRGSGGGAVYVDPGNLTYVFIDTEPTVQHPHFRKYAQPVVKALQSLGVNAESDSRNDLTVDGRKFSGMSASKIGHRVSYGGTLMIDVDIEAASLVLKPSQAKLRAKSVQSVHSRVTNLREHFDAAHRTVSIDQVQQTILTQVFQTTNLAQIPTYRLTEKDWQAIVSLAHTKYGSKTWVFGAGNQHQYYRDGYFNGIGTVGMGFSIQDNHVVDSQIYGDFLQPNSNLHAVTERLDGTEFNLSALTDAFSGADLTTSIGPIPPKRLAEIMLDRSHDEQF